MTTFTDITTKLVSDIGTAKDMDAVKEAFARADRSAQEIFKADVVAAVDARKIARIADLEATLKTLKGE